MPDKTSEERLADRDSWPGPGRPSDFWRGLIIGVAIAVGVCILALAGLAALGFWSMDRGPGMMGRGMMGDRMPDWMMSGRMGPGMMQDMMRDMPVIHNLLVHHEKIRRQVEEIPGGVRTVTTSQDPEVTRLIRTHVQQMKERVEEGRPIRQMDPLFREIFRHHDQIKIHVEEIPGGVRVTETSEDPQVQLLIRQHARQAVSKFVQYGMQGAMRPTPLPEGYRSQR